MNLWCLWVLFMHDPYLKVTSTQHAKSLHAGLRSLSGLYHLQAASHWWLVCSCTKQKLPWVLQLQPSLLQIAHVALWQKLCIALHLLSLTYWVCTRNILNALITHTHTYVRMQCSLSSVAQAHANQYCHGKVLHCSVCVIFYICCTHNPCTGILDRVGPECS